MSRRVSRLRSVRRISRLLAVLIAVVAVGVSTVAPLEVATASASIGTSSTLARSAADPAQSGIAKTSLAGFKPGNIISDAVFTDEKTMSEAQIQSFFNSKVSKCVVGKDENGKPFVCLKDFRINSVNMPADGYCSGYKGATNETAARIIYKVAQACNINPQVLIVMLQKEQGLVTHVWPSGWRYDMALGQGCPDTAPCDPQFVGFFHQIYGAGRQMQIYMEGRWFTWYAPGNTWGILYHPNESCGRGNVYVANKATSALYYYTPYQPNAAAMRAGYGEGDGCSSYGNRNFYNYFTDWFGSTQVPAKCAPPNGGTSPAKLAYVVVPDTIPARVAPRDNCEEDIAHLSEGTIVQAFTVSGSRNWLRVRTEFGDRWIARADVRKSNASEAACTMPTGVGPAKLTYTVISTTMARISPRSGCSLDAQQLSPGMSLTAMTVSGSGLWLKVSTPYGVRWILRADTRKASSSELACAYPTSTRPAKNGYVITAKTVLRDVPIAGCGESQGQLSVGQAVRAVEAVDGWLKVVVEDSEYWIDRSNTRNATTAEGVCIERADIGPAKQTYVTTKEVTARLAQDARCDTEARTVHEGELVTAAAVSGDGQWLKVGIGSTQMWIPRADTRKATAADKQCSLPQGTRSAKLTYVVLNSTTGRIAPAGDCTDGANPVESGSMFTANAVTADGLWLRASINGANLWVPRGDVRKATSSDLACVVPESRSAFKSYVVLEGGSTARKSPNVGCEAGTTTIEAGTVLTATAATLDVKWLRVSVGATQQWIPRENVRYATSADFKRSDATDTTSAKLWYRATAELPARTSPSTDCTSGVDTLREGSVVEAAELSSDGLWLKVRMGAAQRWVLRADLQKVETAVTTVHVNLRSDASTSSTAITTLAPGTRVAVLDERGGWVQVQTRAGTGWVNAPHVR